MKKFLSLIAGLTVSAGVAFAAETVASKAISYSIAPVVNVATFTEADTTTGVGLKVTVENVLVDNSVIAVGGNFYDLGTADLYRFPITVGYNLKVNEVVTVTPNVGLDVNVLDVDNADANASVGFTTGANVAFKVTENLNINTSVAYSVDTVDNVELNGFTFTGSVGYRF